jgi:O-antigen/teichoic acid export membrane protein
MLENFYGRTKRIILSGTLRDTGILFGGNLVSAFLGFVFTLLVARSLSVSEFGVFSVITNAIVILISLSDLGIASGLINFVSEMLSRNKVKESKEYIKAAFISRIVISLIFSGSVLLFSKFVPYAFWVGLIAFIMSPCIILPSVLQARKKFLLSVFADLSFYLPRVAFALFLFNFGKLGIDGSLISFGAGAVIGGVVGILIVGPDFLYSNPKREIYINLVKFSGWLGVNRIISSISGRIDIQMLALMAGTTVTGIYSIPSKLSSFVIILGSSFSSVLASRLAGFGDVEKEREYILKATLALIPITVLIFLWVSVANPFITLLFGEKYIASVPIFQYLTISMIPFLFTVPSVTAIIYAIKKPKFIGVYSFIQLALTVVLNLYLIPKYGAYGPVIVYGIINTVLAVYTWVIVIKHYWFNK